jgi:hypothetical protein
MATITHDHHDYTPIPRGQPKRDILYPLRRWCDRIEIENPKTAHLICRLIPCCCPFERDINFFGHTFHIPPLCKLNPLYNEFVGFRFRALSYLSDVCNEDVTQYIC